MADGMADVRADGMAAGRADGMADGDVAGRADGMADGMARQCGTVTTSRDYCPL